MRNCRLDGGRLVAEPGIVLSFQQFLMPEDGVIDRAPPSLGRLPLGLGSGGDACLPLARDECCWIGLSVIVGAGAASLSILAVQAGAEVDVMSGERWEAATAALRVRPSDRKRVDGLLRSDGRFVPIARGDELSRISRGKSPALLRLRSRRGERPVGGGHSARGLSDLRDRDGPRPARIPRSRRGIQGVASAVNVAPRA